MAQLHIINGDDLADSIKNLDLPGEKIVWREMLCEGPTTFLLDSEKFLTLRTGYLNKTYQISIEDYNKLFIEELNKLTVINGYDEVVLWFEFDLFSHINMLAAVSHLVENKKQEPVHLVCSKKLEGEKEFSPLSQLPAKYLMNHYEQRIPLNKDDLQTASLIWQLYNGNKPDKLKMQITRRSNFEYLSSCIRAHIERFPNSKTGLNSIERNVLRLIKKYNITSKNQLLGYILEYQGYFGFGEPQVKRLMEKLKMFYKEEDGRIILTQEGEEALNGSRNFYQELKNDECLGGVKMYDFLYDDESHRILKL